MEKRPLYLVKHPKGLFTRHPISIEPAFQHSEGFIVILLHTMNATIDRGDVEMYFWLTERVWIQALLL